MERILAIEAPAGAGKTAYLKERYPDAVYLALFPGEGSAEVLLATLYGALLKRVPMTPSLPVMARQIIEGIRRPTVLVIDNAEELTSQASDYLVGMLQNPNLSLVLAGRTLQGFHHLPELVARGEARHIGPEAFAELTNHRPMLTPELVIARYEALEPEMRAALTQMAGRLRWSRDELDPVPYIRAGIPLSIERGWVVPHALLQEVLVERADPRVLVANARALEGEYPRAAAQLYLRLGLHDRVVALARDYVVPWLEQSLWGEVRLWLDPVPFEALDETLKGLYVLALLESGDMRALAYAERAMEASLARSALALHTLRMRDYGQAKGHALAAIERARHPLERLLAERLLIWVRVALGEDVSEDLQAHIARCQGKWPAYYLAGTALLASWQVRVQRDYEAGYLTARAGLEQSIKQGNLSRAVDFLDSLVLAGFASDRIDDTTFELLEELIEVSSMSSRTLLGPLYYHRARARAWVGSLEEALEDVNRTLAHVAFGRWVAVEQGAIELKAELLAKLGRFEEARAAVHQDRSLVQQYPQLQRGDPEFEAAIVAYFEGAVELARMHLDRAQALGMNPANQEIADLLMGKPVSLSPRSFLSARLLGLKESETPKILRLFGTPGIWSGLREIVQLEPKSAAALLYLLERGRARPTELASEVWGDPERRGAVYTALSRLKGKVALRSKRSGEGVVYTLDEPLISELDQKLAWVALHPADWRTVAPERLLPGLESPFVEEIREYWRERLKKVLLEALARGERVPDARMLDTEDPEFLDHLERTLKANS